MVEVLEFSSVLDLMIHSISYGFLLGCFPLVIGLAVHGVVKIFKSI